MNICQCNKEKAMKNDRTRGKNYNNNNIANRTPWTRQYQNRITILITNEKL